MFMTYKGKDEEVYKDTIYVASKFHFSTLLSPFAYLINY